MILALTFLSRMAASLTIAEVSTGSARAGVLTRRYTVPGTVEARDTLDITLPDGLRISGVMAQEGDSVDAGDALLKLDMDGLQDAIEQLERAERDLRGLWYQEDPPASPEEIAAAEAAVTAAEDQVYSAQAQVHAAEIGLSSGDASHARENLQRVMERHNQLVREAELALMAARSKTDMSDEPLVVTAQAAVDSTQAGLRAAERSCEDAGLSQEQQRELAQQAVELAQRTVELTETELASAKKQAENARQSVEALRRQNESEKLQYANERKQKQDTLNQLRELHAQEGIIAAPESGTVRMIAEAGAVPANGTAVILSQAGENFQFTAKTGKETAEQLAVGDAGTLSFTSGGTRRSANVQISSIGTPDVDGQVRLTVSLNEGSFTDGMAGELELEKNSDRYPSILPVSALRVIGGRTVVLVVRETQSVMGTEQTVEDVDVTVKDQDTENMAVEAALFPDDKVVVRSSKPIEKGDRVRAET